MLVETSWENRGKIQQLLLLGDCSEIEHMHPQERPLSKAPKIIREEHPPACITQECVFRLPTRNSDVFLVGDTARRIVKIKNDQIVEEREYIEGFTLEGLLLAPNDVRLALAALEAYHKGNTSSVRTLRDRMSWASEQTLAAIESLPGPVVRCHLDATLANILMDPAAHAARLIDDEYHAMAPAVFDFGIFLAKLKRKNGITLPEALLPDLPGLERASELAHQLWLESR